MGDRVYASITIGGRLETIEEAERLIEALTAEDLFDDRVAGLTELRVTVERGECLWLENDQTNYGAFHRVEAAIATMPGLSCVTKYGAGAGFPEGWTLVTHADGEAVTMPIPTNGSDPCIDRRDLKGYPEMGEAALAQRVRDLLGWIKLADNIPPLTASPAVSAWLKIFGAKAA